MKIDRVIGILSILLQREKVTTSELAEEFEVSRRTIIREIDVTAKFDKSLKWRVIDEFGTELPRFDENGDRI